MRNQSHRSVGQWASHTFKRFIPKRKKKRKKKAGLFFIKPKATRRLSPRVIADRERERKEKRNRKISARSKKINRIRGRKKRYKVRGI